MLLITATVLGVSQLLMIVLRRLASLSFCSNLTFHTHHSGSVDILLDEQKVTKPLARVALVVRAFLRRRRGREGQVHWKTLRRKPETRRTLASGTGVGKIGQSPGHHTTADDVCKSLGLPTIFNSNPA